MLKVANKFDLGAEMMLAEQKEDELSCQKMLLL